MRTHRFATASLLLAILGFEAIACAAPIPTQVPFVHAFDTEQELRDLIAAHPQEHVLWLGDDIVLLFAFRPNPLGEVEWYGAVFVHHVPTASTVTLGGALGYHTVYRSAEAKSRLEGVLNDSQALQQIRGGVAARLGEDEAKRVMDYVRKRHP